MKRQELNGALTQTGHIMILNIYMFLITLHSLSLIFGSILFMYFVILTQKTQNLISFQFYFIYFQEDSNSLKKLQMICVDERKKPMILFSDCAI